MGIINALKKLVNKDKRQGDNIIKNKDEIDNAILEKEDGIEEREIIEDIEYIKSFKEIELELDMGKSEGGFIEQHRDLTEEEIESLIIEEINKVIEVHDDFNQVKVKSREAASRIGIQYLDRVSKYLTKDRRIFDRYHDKYVDREYFNVIIDNSILMIIFSFKEYGVEILAELSQENSNLYLKATNLLCKLASENVKTEEILDGIINNIMVLSDENRIITLGFMSQIKENGRVISVIQYFYKDYLKKGQLENAYKTLNHLINAAERYTEGHLKFLKEVARGNKKINLQYIMVLEEKDPKYIMVDKISEELRVEAAITYYLINPKDKEIKDTLKYLSEYSLNENLRKKIKTVINA